MDLKKNIPNNTITRNLGEIAAKTGNIYDSVKVIAKRSNQISVELKSELSKKLADFASVNEGLEETFENREQIEISKYYERLPKATLIAIDEFLDDKTFYRMEEKEDEK